MISDADLLAYHVPATADDLPTLRRLEKAAIAYVEGRTGRYWGPVTARTEILTWYGWPLALANEPILVDDVPVDLVVEAWEDGVWVQLDASSYSLNGTYLYWETNPPLSQPGRYRVTYATGFAVAAASPAEDDYSDATAPDANEWAAPEDIKQAVHLCIGHWLENREAVVAGSSQAQMPLAVDALLDAHTRAVV